MTQNETPKPTPPVTKAVQRQIGEAVRESGVTVKEAAIQLVEAGNIRPTEKPKFVLKPHLTERPLRGHEGLMALRKQMESSKPPKRASNSANRKEKK